MKRLAHHLERWRNEPEPRRVRLALFIAFGFTACLFVLWLMSFRLTTSLRAKPVINEMASPSAVVLRAKPPRLPVGARPGIIARIKAGWQTVTK